MKKFVKEKLEAIRGDWSEIAQARKDGKLTPAYNPILVYSLSGNGTVRQAMLFRQGEYSGGSAWNVIATKVASGEFKEKYEALGFQVVCREQPKAIRYDKNIGVGREKAVPNLALQARVIKMRLEGLTYMKIEEALELEGKKGFFAMKILRQAEADAF